MMNDGIIFDNIFILYIYIYIYIYIYNTTAAMAVDKIILAGAVTENFASYSEALFCQPSP